MEKLPIRILAFSDMVLPEGSGGVERQIVEVYRRLALSGAAQVELVSLARASEDREEVVPGFGIRRVNRANLTSRVGAQVAISPQVWGAGWTAHRTFRPHVIHANTLFYSTSLTAAWIARRTRTPMVLTAHIGDVHSLPQPYRTVTSLYERTLGRLLVANSAQVICIGQSVRQHVLRLGGTATRSPVIPNGVDSDRFTPRINNVQLSRRPIVVSVGRLIFNKGNQYLIEAAKRLSYEGYDFELWIVGDGPMEAELRRRGADLVSAGRMRMLGHRDDIPDLLRSADIFVRASLTESMPMGVLEAMACGLAVVASDVGSTKEALRDGIDGVLVPPGRVAPLVRVLAGLLENPQRRRELGGSARQRANGFSWDNVAAKTGEVLALAARGVVA